MKANKKIRADAFTARRLFKVNECPFLPPTCLLAENEKHCFDLANPTQ